MYKIKSTAKDVQVGNLVWITCEPICKPYGNIYHFDIMVEIITIGKNRIEVIIPTDHTAIWVDDGDFFIKSQFVTPEECLKYHALQDVDNSQKRTNCT